MTSCCEDQECGLCPHLMVANVNSLQVTSSEPRGICREWRRFAGVTQQNQLCGSKGRVEGLRLSSVSKTREVFPLKSRAAAGSRGSALLGVAPGWAISMLKHLGFTTYCPRGRKGLRG